MTQVRSRMERSASPGHLMSVALETVANGVDLPVRAQPGSRRNGITGIHDGRLKVAVTQVAEKGKANAAIVEVLATALGLRSSQISLVSGDTHPQKRFRITGISAEELATRITAVLP